jgi:hypothetical protein
MTTGFLLCCLKKHTVHSTSAKYWLSWICNTGRKRYLYYASTEEFGLCQAKKEVGWGIRDKAKHCM